MLLAMSDPRLMHIQSLLHKTGKSYRWLAEAVGSNHQTVANVVDGVTKNPRDESIISRMVSALEELPPAKNKITAVKQMLRPCPVYNGIMAGPPGELRDELPDSYENIPEWGGDFERWGRTISGDSMVPILKPGDIVIFENRRFELGHVVQAFKDGEDCIKAYRMVDGAPMLCSFNEDGPSFSAKDWVCGGVCVMRVRYNEFGIRTQADFPNGLTWAMRSANI